MPKEKDIKLNKTISLPFGLISAILDESATMGKDFSSTCAVLLKLGLVKRREQENKYKDEIEDEAKKILGAHS